MASEANLSNEVSDTQHDDQPAADILNILSFKNHEPHVPGKLNRPSSTLIRPGQSGILSATNENAIEDVDEKEDDQSDLPENEPEEDQSDLQESELEEDQSDLVEKELEKDQGDLVENQLEEDQSDLVEKELYGTQAEWKIALEAAKELAEAEDLPALSTDVVKPIVNMVQRAGEDFKKLGQKSILDNVETKEDIEEVIERLADIDAEVSYLAKEVKNLDGTIKEEKTTEKRKSGRSKSEIQRSKITKDLYAHAIPNFVFMLRWGLCCISMDYSRPKDTRYIKAIINIQDATLKVDKIAGSRKYKLSSDDLIDLIVKSNRKEIIPRVRLVRKAFAEQLDSRRQLIAKIKNEVELKKCHDRRDGKIQQGHEERAKRRMENGIRLKEDLTRRSQLDSNQNPKTSRLPSIPSSGSSTADVLWTFDQNLELMKQLQNPETRYLPGSPLYVCAHQFPSLTLHTAEERYLAILNTPLLQNKLPEHIRDRAVYYKDSMIHCWGAQDYVQSIE